MADREKDDSSEDTEMLEDTGIAEGGWILHGIFEW